RIERPWSSGSGVTTSPRLATRPRRPNRLDGRCHCPNSDDRARSERRLNPLQTRDRPVARRARSATGERDDDAEDYVETDPLDLDHLSMTGGNSRLPAKATI